MQTADIKAERKRTKGEATRQSILDAAEIVFAELGFSLARLEDVAQAVGIRRASIVYYFRNKQELYDAVEADIYQVLNTATAERLAAAGGPLQRLYALCDSWLDFMVARPAAARILQRVSADVTPRADDPVRYSDFSLQSMEAVLAEGRAAGQFAEIDPMMVVNLMGGAILHFVCNATSFGSHRTYSAPARLEAFRRMLHGAVGAAVLQGRDVFLSPKSN